LPTICEARFQESVELFWLPSCLVTLYTSQWIDLYGIDVVERTRSIKVKAFGSASRNARLGELFSMILDAVERLPGVGLFLINLL
jgi:hypothetical protein